MRQTLRTAVAAAAITFAAVAFAQDAGMSNPATETMAPRNGPTDPEIAHIAVTANQIDINAGKQALSKSKNAKVKEFAKRMVDDHTSVIAQATALAKKLGVTPKDNTTSKSLNSAAEKKLKDLAKLKGDAYDKAYVDNEVAYHEAVIDAVDKTLLPNTQNAELKGLLEKVRPALQAHLEHAKMIQSELSGK